MWTKEWPTERGYYWFFGWCFRHRHYAPDIHFVKIRIGGDGKSIYVTDGHFMFEAEGGEGVWQSADLPELPQL